MLNPAKRQITIPIVENSAAFGVPSQLIGSSVIPRLMSRSSSGPLWV